MAEAQTLEDIWRAICSRDGPLKERLEEYSRAVRDHALPYAEAYYELVARLSAGEGGAGAPAVGETLPPFLLPDCDARLVSLDDVLATGPAVISFNRGHWCEYCAIELSALKQAFDAFAAAGARVVSIMPETREYIAKSRDQLGGPFTILSDIDNSYALDLGLPVWVGDRMRELYQADGVDLELFQRNAMWFVPIPATFVVGTDGVILARTVDPDFRRRMEIDDIVAALKTAQRPHRAS